MITQAISELQESKVNTKTGAPHDDMLPLSKIAQGMHDQDATYDDFVTKTQGPYSDQQRATAWDGMKQAKQVMTDIKDQGKRYQDLPEVEYIRQEGVKDNIDEVQLMASPVWVQSGKTVIDYFNPNGSDGMDEKEVHDFNLNLMSQFNYNLPMMMFYTNEIVQSQDPELAKSFLFLMDQNKATNISTDSVGRAIAGIGGDATSYMTLGGSVIISKLAGASMKAGIRQTLTKILSVTAVDAAAGGTLAASSDISEQTMEGAAGEKDKLDVEQVGETAAIGAAATAVLGVGVASVADPALRKFGVGATRNAIDKLKGMHDELRPPSKHKPNSQKRDKKGQFK